MKLTKYDNAFSIYKRLKDRIPGTQKIKCCCCGQLVNWKEADNAHFIPRSNASTRYDEHNCHACCKTCNQFLDGNLQAYERFLFKQYGQKEVDRLKADKFKTVKLSKSDLDEMLIFWKSQIKEMIK